MSTESMKSCFALVAAAGLPGAAFAQPVTSPWPVNGPDDTTAVSAAAVSGWYAAADAFEDSVEVRDIHGVLRRTITRAEIQTLLPWMSLTAGPDGPSALAWTDSGRVLFVLIHDSALAPDGMGSDAVLRCDVPSGILTVYVRLDAFDREDEFPHLSVAHFRARLYVGTAQGGLRIYNALANSTTGSLVSSALLPDGEPVRGITVDREAGMLFVASAENVYRAGTASVPPVYTPVGSLAGARALAYADHYGAPGGANVGLYVLRAPGAADAPIISFVPPHQAAASQAYAPSTYLTGTTAWHDLVATADGALLLGADEDAMLIRDASDTRLAFNPWLADEFNQHVTFARGLVSPDGEPAGWVIDGDVSAGGTRFHPATPDGAAWVILISLAHDRIASDPADRALVREILERYAGLAAGPAPVRSADGLYLHWIDPVTGANKPGWPVEYATLSAMKIVCAAARAMAFYPDDARIARAASRIIFGTRNWAAYVRTSPDGLFLKGQAAGGADGSVVSLPFMEGIIFAEQAGWYGGGDTLLAYQRWLTRPLWPTATYLVGRQITGAVQNRHQSAFLSMYPLILQRDYRASPSWRAQIQNLRWSSAAWTDDNGARWYTVFSAGTTRPEFGGYRADSLGEHPGNFATFPSLLALGATGETSEAVAGYHAYRKGAREHFATGASLLYRRSGDDPAFLPNSAGLPDVTLGALGLAELLRPGILDEVFATPYPAAEMCPLDVTGDGLIDLEDVYRVLASPADLNGDGAANATDARCLARWLRRHEGGDGAQR